MKRLTSTSNFRFYAGYYSNYVPQRINVLYDYLCQRLNALSKTITIDRSYLEKTRVTYPLDTAICFDELKEYPIVSW